MNIDTHAIIVSQLAVMLKLLWNKKKGYNIFLPYMEVCHDNNVRNAIISFTYICWRNGLRLICIQGKVIVYTNKTQARVCVFAK